MCGLANIGGEEFKKIMETNFYIFFFFYYKIIDGYPSWTFVIEREKSRRVCWSVTGCHAGSLEGQRHPEELSQLVGHLPASYGGGLLAVVFAIHL